MISQTSSRTREKRAYLGENVVKEKAYLSAMTVGLLDVSLQSLECEEWWLMGRKRSIEDEIVQGYYC
jgi:hypothetical protein